jgi:hypothetical protein
MAKSVHVRPESLFTFLQNRCSRSHRKRVHVAPEYALNPNDKLHVKAQQASASLGKVRLLTTEMVLDELLSALSKVPIRHIAVIGVQTIRSNPNVEVIPQTSLQFSAGFDLYRSMADKVVEPD